MVVSGSCQPVVLKEKSYPKACLTGDVVLLYMNRIARAPDIGCAGFLHVFWEEPWLIIHGRNLHDFIRWCKQKIL